MTTRERSCSRARCGPASTCPWAHRRRAERRLLDLRTGTLMRSGSRRVRAAVDAVRLCRLAARHGPAGRGAGRPSRARRTAAAAHDGHGLSREEMRGTSTSPRTGSGDARDRGGGAATGDRGRWPRRRRAAGRLGCTLRRSQDGSDWRGEYLEQAEALGFDACSPSTAAPGRAVWADAEVVIEGDTTTSRAGGALRRVPPPRRGRTPARRRWAPAGSTGDAYAGHVFWDADVFVLPALAAIRPAAARAMLEYRIRRLPAARRRRRARMASRRPLSLGVGRRRTATSPRARSGDPAASSSRSRRARTRSTSWPTWPGPRRTTPPGRGTTRSSPGAGRDCVVDTARYWASRIPTRCRRPRPPRSG